MIRLFQFKNNFFRENETAMEAEFSTVGYFDGLDMEVIENSDPCSREVLSDVYHNLSYPDNSWKLLESCDYFNVAGITQQDDREFWDSPENPLFFISFIRMKYRSKNLEELIKKIEENENIKCYLTFDSSDVITCIRTSKYTEGCKRIEKFHQIVVDTEPGNKIQKCFSIFAVRQSILDSLIEDNGNIKDENVDCFLYGVINNRDKIEVFYNKLVRDNPAACCSAYEVLGSDDIVIMLQNISIICLLRMYAKNGMLVHYNKRYREAFYNIRSEIAINKGYGRSDESEQH